MKTAVIDVGGGLRGIFGAGIFDYCIDNNINFDCSFGVSAGSANVASYLAGQRGRNYTFYTQYAFRKEYMSIENLFKVGSYMDFEYIYGSLCNTGGENPLDYKAISQNPGQMIVVATDARSGKAVYFDKSFLRQDDYSILKASCSIPVVCKPYPIGTSSYFDGGVSDPVPLQKAVDDGYDKIVLVLTKPKDYLLKSAREQKAAKALSKKYPGVAEKLVSRGVNYKGGLIFADELAKEGRALVLAPDSIGGMDTLTRDRKKLIELYHKGYDAAKKIPEFLGM